MSFSAQNYLPPPPQQYYPPHSPPLTDAQAQRKRPKYTRSKTGCMTCRVKKIKCDETKPNCMRCTHGQRDCTWPDGVPPRKKQPGRKDSFDGRPSTASSSVSEDSTTPPTRDPTPPRRTVIDVGLPPLASRRHNDPYLQLPPVMSPESEHVRRQCVRSGYAPEMGGMTQDMSCYPRYEQQQDAYASMQYRPAGHGHTRQMPVAQWSTPSSLMPPVESYYHSAHERHMVGQHHRYQ
ncbi:uncharacterized protein EV420DRAFT_191786 [Desarmillaria tabescens]|uniref:Zn(2)-C6 fungal-type domain-containing protein n=1 Tax=Armillaria tabescens TaxID=1929756 RepID=A0AA39TNV0_ARMTA|nr:uncharacterized protein EV420DRAFT_191786 [Desarmillaria tabescens]KAK0461293.1 hypothetical protein EV420DRAFT_191786 [Desarmillaria tabescens]